MGRAKMTPKAFVERGLRLSWREIRDSLPACQACAGSGLIRIEGRVTPAQLPRVRRTRSAPEVSQTNSTFAGYATRVAFNINLSAPQIRVMGKIANTMGACQDFGDYYERSMAFREFLPDRSRENPDSFISSANALVRKGLVEFNEAARARAITDPKPKWHWRLTPAGEHLHALLVIAGLSIAIAPKKKGRKAA